MSEKGTLLIIDDETSMLEILDQFMSERGYSVDTASDGRQAIERLSGRGYEVALVDLKLPDMDGLDIVARINEDHPETKCVIMTAFASLESTIEAFRLSVYDYILKPFDLMRIGEIVDAAYEQALMIRENAGKISKLESANRMLEESREELNRQIYETNEELTLANDSLKKHVTRLKMLYQMGRDISSNENWSDALDRFLMALSRYLEADGAALLMFSDSGSVLKVRTSYSLTETDLEDAVSRLLAAGSRDLLIPEIFSLDECSESKVETCLEMKRGWRDTIVPLVYKGRWLGFLQIRKKYRTRRSFMSDYHFITTIQTILTEEVANAVNISTLRNLKDFNETILENIGSGVIKTDRGGKVVFRNKRAKELIDGDSAQRAHFDDIFHNPMGSGGLFDHLIRKEEDSVSMEGTLALDEVRSIPVRLNTTRIRTDDFQGSTIIAVFEDLTAQKEMEEELRRADRLRSLGELSAGVAHEIRNPLTGIATTAQVLKEQLRGESDKVEYLTVILDEIRRLDDIIRNLLTFARPALPRPEEVEIAALVRDTLGLISDKAAERKVDVEVVSDLQEGGCYLDRDQIRQVILNISKNGIEACDAGGKLEVGVRAAEDPVFFRIEFTDTGCGVPSEAADKLYNPFFTTRSEGTGLGLSISRKIIESHGGRIFHEDIDGKGTRFVVEIPRRIAATPDSSKKEKVS